MERRLYTVLISVPVNATTRRPYRGVNNLMLQLEAQGHGYARNCWMTYRQAGELGAQVRKGEHGAPIVFYKLNKAVAATPDTLPQPIEEDVPERYIPLLRMYTVFNIAQIDGLPSELAEPEPSVPAWPSEEAAQQVIAASGAAIRHAGAQKKTWWTRPSGGHAAD